MIRVYGSELCPDCRACRKNFDAQGIAYVYIDINESLANMKEFLAMRDENSVFDGAKKDHYIGIPAMVKEDGTVTLNWESFLDTADECRQDR